MALLFVDRDAEDHHNRGDDPKILDAADLNAETRPVSRSPVQTAAREVGLCAEPGVQDTNSTFGCSFDLRQRVR